MKYQEYINYFNTFNNIFKSIIPINDFIILIYKIFYNEYITK